MLRLPVLDFAKYKDMLPYDTVNDLRRARARVGNEPDGVDWVTLLKEKGTDKLYRNIILCLLTAGGVPDPCKKKMGENRVVAVEEKHSGLKRIRQDNVVVGARIRETDKVQCVRKGTGAIERVNLVDGEKQAGRGRGRGKGWFLKVYPKSGVGNKIVKEGPLEFADKALYGEKEEVRGRGRRPIAVAGEKLVDQLDNDHLHNQNSKGKNPMIQHQSGSVPQAQPIEAKRRGRKRKEVVGKEEPVASKDDHSHNQNSKGKNLMTQHQSGPVPQDQPIDAKQRGRKRKEVVVKEEPVANKEIFVKKEIEKISQVIGSRNSRVSRKCSEDVDGAQLGKKHAVNVKTEVMEVDNELPNKKTAFQNVAVKEEPIDYVENRLPKKRMLERGNGERYSEGQGSNKSVSEIEILNHDDVVKEGNFSPFISSKRFHSTMRNEESQNLSRRSAKDEFRKELLEVLRKPFNKKEYREYREEFQYGSYRKLNPGAQKRLTKYRYNRQKRLVILRGFFFWLKNLTREGSFRPWKDEECLAVEIPPPC